MSQLWLNPIFHTLVKALAGMPSVLLAIFINPRLVTSHDAFAECRVLSYVSRICFGSLGKVRVRS